MGWSLLAHIGIPLLFGLSFVLISITAAHGPITWDVAVEAALDLAILGIGATGAIFENPKLIAAFGPENALVGIGIVGLNMVLAAGVVVIKRFAVGPDHQVRCRWALVALFLGSLTLVVVAGILAWGFSTPAYRAG